jgi:transposase InsO family protein
VITAWPAPGSMNCLNLRLRVKPTLNPFPGEGFMTPAPSKCPHPSYTRFKASQPNETGQSHFSHSKIRNDRDIEILNFIHVHSRLLIASRVAYVTTSLFVVGAFRDTCNGNDLPSSVLTDNGAIFTARTRNGRNAFESEMASLKIAQKNSHLYHPQTCSKVERFQQTLKKRLTQQAKVTSIGEFQKQLDQFHTFYNFARLHHSLE